MGPINTPLPHSSGFHVAPPHPLPSLPPLLSLSGPDASLTLLAHFSATLALSPQPRAVFLSSSLLLSLIAPPSFSLSSLSLSLSFSLSHPSHCLFHPSGLTLLPMSSSYSGPTSFSTPSPSPVLTPPSQLECGSQRMWLVHSFGVLWGSRHQGVQGPLPVWVPTFVI